MSGTPKYRISPKFIFKLNCRSTISEISKCWIHRFIIKNVKSNKRFVQIQYEFVFQLVILEPPFFIDLMRRLGLQDLFLSLFTSPPVFKIFSRKFKVQNDIICFVNEVYNRILKSYNIFHSALYTILLLKSYVMTLFNDSKLLCWRFNMILNLKCNYASL